MPVGRLLEGMCSLQQRAFLEVVADQLKADRHRAFAEGTLLHAAHAFQQATDWHARAP